MPRHTESALFNREAGIVERYLFEEDVLVEARKVLPFGLHLVRGLLVGVEVEGAGGHDFIFGKVVGVSELCITMIDEMWESARR